MSEQRKDREAFDADRERLVGLLMRSHFYLDGFGDGLATVDDFLADHRDVEKWACRLAKEADE